jgi:hypothetical protein
MPEETALTNQAPDMALTKAGFMPQTFDQAWRYAQALATTQFVPATYQGKPNDCFIAIDVAHRLGVHPLMFLQNSYIVHGRPAMEAKLILSLVNQSKLFVDPLEYEVVGEDPSQDDYKVRAFATRESTGSVLYGPWITWKLVKGEGWESKGGSKWKTMPEVMFHYRAASWFTNRHCPEVKMGFMTTEEAQEVEDTKTIESKVIPTKPGRHSFRKTAKDEAKTRTPSDTDGNGAKEGPKEDASPDPTTSPTEDTTETSSPDPTSPASDAETQTQPEDGDATDAPPKEKAPSSDEPTHVCMDCSKKKKEAFKIEERKGKFICMTCLSAKSVKPIEN